MEKQEEADQHTRINPITTVLGVALLLAACGTTTKTEVGEYAFKNYYRGSSSKEFLSKDRIDNRPSYEAFFTLEKPEECIRITVIAKNNAIQSAYMDPSVRACLVVEKALDVSAFNLRTGNTIYVEIGRNYDINWKSERETVVCSAKDSPLRKLTPGLYRIRITAFEARDFSFSIAIASNTAQAVVAGPAIGEAP